MPTFSGLAGAQNPIELAAFIDLLATENVRSYLEIGARHGDTFHAVMSSLPAGSVGVVVDLPGNVWGRENSLPVLLKACTDLREKGYRITTIIGDSRDAANIARAAEHGPFDAILIDGDHRYEGVSADWQNYGSLGRIVAFHDIVGHNKRARPGVAIEVPRLWAEIKASHPAAVIKKFVAPDSVMGIGVIIR